MLREEMPWLKLPTWEEVHAAPIYLGRLKQLTREQLITLLAKKVLSE
jgi:hypothetical protein